MPPQVEQYLFCGDSLDCMQKIQDGSIDCVVTDPPYRNISGGVAGKEHQPSGILGKNKGMSYDGKIFCCNDVDAEQWMPEIYRVLKDNSHCYIFCNLLNLFHFAEVAQLCGFKIHNLLVWHKNNATPNRWYMKNAEYILFLRKGKAKCINLPGSMTVVSCDNILRGKLHPTQKPTDLLELYIKNSSKKEQVILDPFMGSGSTGVACANTGRKFIGIELDPKYFDIAKERIEQAYETQKQNGT